MHLAKVIAKVISTQKAPSLVGGKLLVIQAVDAQSNIIDSSTPYVALDKVGAGLGDCVLVEWGGSLNNNSDMVGDMSIVGIVDEIQTEK